MGFHPPRPPAIPLLRLRYDLRRVEARSFRKVLPLLEFAARACRLRSEAWQKVWGQAHVNCALGVGLLPNIYTPHASLPIRPVTSARFAASAH
jgi:hypothetical protein